VGRGYCGGVGGVVRGGVGMGVVEWSTMSGLLGLLEKKSPTPLQSWAGYGRLSIDAMGRPKEEGTGTR